MAQAQAQARLDTFAILLTLLLCALWGGQQVVIKLTAPHVTPLLQAGLRSAGATLLLWAWMRWRGVPLFDRDGTLLPGIAAGLLFGAEFAVIYTGLQFTAASRAAIFLYTAPFWVALGAHLFIPGETIRRVQVAGLACAFLGIVAAFHESLNLPSRRELIGDALMLLAALLWGATTVLIKATKLARIHPGKTLFYQLAVSGLTLPAVSLLIGEAGVVRMDGWVAASLAFQTVAVAFASYLAWFWLVSRYPAARLSAFTFVTPLMGVAAGALWLGEPVTLPLLIALILVAAGITLVNKPKS